MADLQFDMVLIQTKQENKLVLESSEATLQSKWAFFGSSLPNCKDL